MFQECDPFISYFIPSDSPQCIAFSIIFLLISIAGLIVGSIRLWNQRNDCTCPLFISTLFMTTGYLLFMIKHILMLARYQGLILHAFLFLIIIIMFLSSMTWVVIFWCNILMVFNENVVMVKTTKMAILIFNAMFIIVSVVGMSIYWAPIITNIVLLVIYFAILFIICLVGSQLYRKFQSIGLDESSMKSKSALKKMNQIKIYSLVSVIVLLLMVISLISFISGWVFPKTMALKIVWLCHQRFITVAPTLVFIFCKLPKNQMKDKSRDSISKPSGRFAVKKLDIVMETELSSDIISLNESQPKPNHA